MMTRTRMVEMPTEIMLPVSSGGLSPVVMMVISPFMICAHASQEAIPHALPMIAAAAQSHQRLSALFKTAKLTARTSMVEMPTEMMLPVSSGGLSPVVMIVIFPCIICVHASQEAILQAMPMIAAAVQIRKSAW